MEFWIVQLFRATEGRRLRNFLKRLTILLLLLVGLSGAYVYNEADCTERLIAASDQPKLQFADDDTWVEVFPDVFVYSAFLEEIQAGTWQVRLISVVRKDLVMLRHTPIDVQCWVGAGTAVFLAEAGLRLVPEDHDLPYSAAFFTCPVKLPSEVIDHPTVRVALGSHWNMTRPKWVMVHKAGNSSLKFCSVCVRPINVKFDQLSLITEFIGYYTSMGISRFDFYIYDVSKEAALLLSHMKGHSGALIQLHKWNLSLNKSHILECGQLAAVQDCIYRSRFVSEYLISVDFDEFLVPRKKRSIPEALLSVETAVGKNVLGSMVIQNQFFCREYPYNSALLRQVPPLLSLIENVREAIPWEHNVRSKYITRPNATVVGGVHFVWEHRPGLRKLHVPADEIVLHHYRTCCGLTKNAWLGFFPYDFLQEEEVKMTSQSLSAKVLIKPSLSTGGPDGELKVDRSQNFKAKDRAVGLGRGALSLPGRWSMAVADISSCSSSPERV
ncbi:hypothetical protein HPB47_014153 [Ixodes persulcatus]|uniref:Uncharacterized protein n=1 Tax=Ixodes persulcatus TaxID=34615 RepID=A0AC60R089_IXOPE|nr:hypothetical protein HPB47_014153 [Ixodes persulcatus]